MQRELPVRKKIRLEGHDYSQVGAYFVTICVENRHEMLGEVVGRDALIAPRVRLSEYGEIVTKHIERINVCYTSARVDHYVVMPNHIHMLISIHGAMKASRPTVSTLVRSLKTMITKDFGFSLFQTSFHDHIIRDEADYRRIWQYIDENPAKWTEDQYYTK